MEFYMNLPRNKREFAIFMAIISLISVNIIAPIITFFEIGFHTSIWIETLKVIPFIWTSVIALVLLTYKPAERLTYRVVKEGDSFSFSISLFVEACIAQPIARYIMRKIHIRQIDGLELREKINF